MYVPYPYYPEGSIHPRYGWIHLPTGTKLPTLDARTRHMKEVQNAVSPGSTTETVRVTS
jgi:hypothetical protein